MPKKPNTDHDQNSVSAYAAEENTAKCADNIS